MIKAGRLRGGDLVALVAPAGAVPPEQAASAERILAGWGLRTRVGRHALGRHTYLSGTDDERLSDLNEALRDPEVRGVLCLRGGYGTQRIVDLVDFGAVRADPKMVIGFSDITALHVALWCETGLASVHGPTGGTLREILDCPTTAAARHAVMTTEPVVAVAGSDPVVRAGRAEGVLLGGNLTLLASTAGTRHRPDLSGAILLIEEVSEEPYRVDRSITQLKRAGWFDGLAGVAVGQFTDCEPRKYPEFTVEQVLAGHLLDLGIPVLGGLPIGHGDQQTAVGLGVPAVLDAGAGTLTVEPAGR
ncbi:LD-carboxypeptidase [Actinoplanes hulinensis]|uniref:LD-carboxypeptidase n=1 Tax=Actinoplanes hulinensis TaxID=1144547 RepID=A0ABS7B8S5_9ACTN|nr:LD-carboxypeptidase [Actinoplanes hulinensis]MBW6437443.1 LD-carboxypeptidase [Actinoplanes hulinensis]